MKRKHFLRQGLMGLGAAATAPAVANAWSTKHHRPDQRNEQVGFNHLPATAGTIHTEGHTMKTVLHKANSRGHANHGWLDSHHSFSFANYYNPERMHFGVLRVLNDDIVDGGRGFGRHPHDNMEIISIPLSGSLEHQDSMGNTHVIKANDIQVMSAGKGIFHSEFNREADKTNFLQIWVFPNKQNVEPRYDQLPLDPADRKNRLQQILSPVPEDEGVWIHQDAWFHRGDLDAGRSVNYSVKREGNGVYVFVLEGQVTIAGQQLDKRDGLGITGTTQVEIIAGQASELLVMDVPMTL
ncbi:MAG: pirin family protein [Bacteroidota bacterium]